MSHLDVAWKGLLGSVEKVIRGWCPPCYGRELEYHKDLQAFLQERIDQAQIDRPYPHNGNHADLCVHWPSWSGLRRPYRVFIEVKRDLQRKSDYDRLVGQVTDMDPGQHLVMVVLCGNTRPDLVAKLRVQFRKYLDDDWSPTLTIVVAPSEAA